MFRSSVCEFIFMTTVKKICFFMLVNHGRSSWVSEWIRQGLPYIASGDIPGWCSGSLLCWFPCPQPVSCYIRFSNNIPCLAWMCLSDISLRGVFLKVKRGRGSSKILVKLRGCQTTSCLELALDLNWSGLMLQLVSFAFCQRFMWWWWKWNGT